MVSKLRNALQLPDERYDGINFLGLVNIVSHRKESQQI